MPSKWHTHYFCTYVVWKYVSNKKKDIVTSGYKQSWCSAVANTWKHTPFYIFFLTLAECSLTFPFLTLVVHFAWGYKLLHLIDCKRLCHGQREAAHQFRSDCLYKNDYIRTAVSWTGSSHTHDLSTINDLHSAQCLFHRNINVSHYVHCF